MRLATSSRQALTGASPRPMPERSYTDSIHLLSIDRGLGGIRSTQLTTSSWSQFIKIVVFGSDVIVCPRCKRVQPRASNH